MTHDPVGRRLSVGGDHLLRNPAGDMRERRPEIPEQKSLAAPRPVSASAAVIELACGPGMDDVLATVLGKDNAVRNLVQRSFDADPDVPDFDPAVGIHDVLARAATIGTVVQGEQ